MCSFFNRFTSDRLDNQLGFALQYQNNNAGEALRIGSCGGNFSAPKGIFTSPSFPEAYPEDQSCTYTISLPAGYVINVTFLVFQIRCNDKVGSDYLEIRDGSSHTSQRMFMDCSDGTHIPVTLQSTGNTLWLK